MLAAYILLAFSDPAYRPKFTTLTISIILFLGALILTSFTGVNFARSFWSSFERMAGLLTYFHVFAFYIILVNVFREKKDWERILNCSILAGVFLALYILLNNQIFSEEAGTIGNTSFMAAYLLFDTFFALIFFFTKKGKWRFFYGISLLILSLVLLTSNCRGAIVAFFSGIFFLTLGYFIFFRRRMLKRFVSVVIISLIISGGIFLTGKPNFIKSKLNAVLGLPTVQARFVVWKISWQGWRERFWLGWGPENFQIAFNKYFDPRLTLSNYGGEFVFDRAHNIVFDVGVTSGLLGLLCYLAVFVISIFALLRICQKSMGRGEAVIPLGAAVTLIVYFIQNLLVFDTASTYIMFFLTLAFANYILEEERFKKIKEGELIRKKASPLFKTFGAVLIIAIIPDLYFGNIQPAKSCRYTAQAMESALKEAIPLYQKALSISPRSQWELAYYFSEQVSSAISGPKQNKGILQKGFQLAEEEMKKSIKKNPLTFQLYMSLGRLYNNSVGFSLGEEKLEKAEADLQKAIELNPRNQQGYWELAQTKIFQKKYKEAFGLLQQAIDLEPRLPQSHWCLAMAYKMAGQDKLAEEKIREIKKTSFNWVGKTKDLKMVIGFYRDLGDYSTVAFLYQEGLKSNPRSSWFRAGLAKANAKLRR